MLQLHPDRRCFDELLNDLLVDSGFFKTSESSYDKHGEPVYEKYQGALKKLPSPSDTSLAVITDEDFCLLSEDGEYLIRSLTLLGEHFLVNIYKGQPDHLWDRFLLITKRICNERIEERSLSLTD